MSHKKMDLKPLSLGCDCWRQIVNIIRDGVSKMSQNVRGGS